ncbi:UBA-like superfamily [Sesbania bispinosa]|nr:UBA-like superfamily [Sesbania bispinosa]
MKVHIESRKRKRQKKATDSAIENVLQMGFERSRVLAAFEAGGTLEQVVQRLTANPENDPTSFAENAQPQIPSDHSKAERDVEMEDELSADIAKADAFADYDIEVNIEGEAITEYLSSIEFSRQP